MFGIGIGTWRGAEMKIGCYENEALDENLRNVARVKLLNTSLSDMISCYFGD